MRERFSERLDGELGGESLAELDTHLAACASCADAYRRFEEAVGEVHGLPRHPVPRDFAAEVTARLESAQHEIPSARARWWERSVGWAAAFVLGLGLAVVYVELRVSGAGSSTETGVSGSEVADLQKEIGVLRTVVREAGDSARKDRQRLATAATHFASDVALLTRAAEAQSQLHTDRLVELRDALELAEQRVTAALTEQSRAVAAERERWHELEQQLASAQQGMDDMRGDSAAMMARIDELSLSLASVDPMPGSSAPVVASIEPADDEDEIEDEIELAPALVMRNYGGARRTLEPNFDHPDTIAELFELYDSGHPQVQSLAFSVIEQHFRAPAREFVAARMASQRGGARRGLGELFGNDVGHDVSDDATSWNTQRARLVESYRQFWYQLRGQQRGAPITLNVLRKLEKEQ